MPSEQLHEALRKTERGHQKDDDDDDVYTIISIVAVSVVCVCVCSFWSAQPHSSDSIPPEFRIERVPILPCGTSEIGHRARSLLLFCIHICLPTFGFLGQNPYCGASTGDAYGNSRAMTRTDQTFSGPFWFIGGHICLFRLSSRTPTRQSENYHNVAPLFSDSSAKLFVLIIPDTWWIPLPYK